MFRLATSLTLAGCLLLAGTSASAQNLLLPSVNEATDALVDMFAGTGLSRPSKVRLGTCITALEASYPGQVACTVSVTLGAATTETQADFYKQGKKWKAQPSSSQSKLPFPDPKLHE